MLPEPIQCLLGRELRAAQLYCDLEAISVQVVEVGHACGQRAGVRQKPASRGVCTGGHCHLPGQQGEAGRGRVCQGPPSWTPNPRGLVPPSLWRSGSPGRTQLLRPSPWSCPGLPEMADSDTNSCFLTLSWWQPGFWLHFPGRIRPSQVDTWPLCTLIPRSVGLRTPPPWGREAGSLPSEFGAL